MERELINTDRILLRGARITSMLFTPFSIPLLTFVLVFGFSYLRMMPFFYKAYVLGIVAFFTIIFPALTINLYKKLQGYTRHDLQMREARYVPYMFTILGYALCFILLKRVRLPWYMSGMIISALVSLIVCIIVNIRWKLSEHMTGAGIVVGGLIAYSFIFVFNPVWWLCLAIFVSGVLGTARIILGHHTFSEVLAGFILGYFAALIVIHPTYNILFRYILI